MNRRFVAYLVLVPSIVLYGFQITLFTTSEELLVYGAFGLLWFLLVVGRSGARPLLLATLSALGLGFVPHRLRLGTGLAKLDTFVVLVPLAHFLGMYAFCWLRDRSAGLTDAVKARGGLRKA